MVKLPIIRLWVLLLVLEFVNLSEFHFELNSTSEEGKEGDEFLWTCKLLSTGENLPGGVRFFLEEKNMCSLYLTSSNLCKKTNSSEEPVDCFCSEESNTTFFLNITLGHQHTGNWSCGEISKVGSVSSAIYLNVKGSYIGTPTIIINPNGGKTPTSTESTTLVVDPSSSTALALTSTQVSPFPVLPPPNNHYIYTGAIIGGVLCLAILGSVVIVKIRKRKAHHQSRNDSTPTKKTIQENNTPMVEIIENDLYVGSDNYFIEDNSRPQVEIIENEVYQGSDHLQVN